MNERVSPKNETIKIINSLIPHVRTITNLNNLPSEDMDWKYVRWANSAQHVYMALKMWKLKFASELESSYPRLVKPLNEAYQAIEAAMRSFKKFEETKWEGNPEGWRAFWTQLSEELTNSSNLTAAKLVEASKNTKIDYSSKEYRKEVLERYKNRK